MKKMKKMKKMKATKFRELCFTSGFLHLTLQSVLLGSKCHPLPHHHHHHYHCVNLHHHHHLLIAFIDNHAHVTIIIFSIITRLWPAFDWQSLVARHAGTVTHASPRACGAWLGQIVQELVELCKNLQTFSKVSRNSKTEKSFEYRKCLETAK